jgi:hypothetical protein
LESRGLTVGRIREAVVGLAAAPVEPVGPWRGGAQVRRKLARGKVNTPAVDDLNMRARGLAIRRALSSADVLRALLADGDSQAARALASLGVSAEDAERALAATPVAGTTDETAEDAVARMVHISKQDDRVVVEIIDPKLTAGLHDELEDLRVSLADVLDLLRQSLWREARRAQGGGGASMEG